MGLFILGEVFAFKVSVERGIVRTTYYVRSCLPELEGWLRMQRY